MYWLRYLLKEPYHAFKSPMGRQMLTLFRKYADVPRYQPTTVRFWSYQLQVPDAFSFCWQFKEIFVDELYRFSSKHSAPRILDCGSNVGVSILYFKKLFPHAHITAFEADPTIANYLKKNLETNGIQGVEIVEKAVWKDDLGVTFASDGADGGSIKTDGNAQTIPSVRLRSILEQESHIDFLKIDIEGAETEVLADCQDVLQHVENLFVEYHAYIGQPQYLAELLAIFTKNGFRYYIDTNQHRSAPFVNHRYRDNNLMDLQLNIVGYRMK
ncbi:MAG: FkbM family methyltransferase [Spirosomataceae bacterium]